MPQAKRGAEKFKFASLLALPKWGLEGSCKWTTHAKNGSKLNIITVKNTLKIQLYTIL